MSIFPTRRSFLKSATMAGAAVSLNALQYSRVYGANSRLGIASVGTGGKGWSDLNGVAASPDVEVIALCDIDSSAKHLGQAAEKYRSPAGVCCVLRPTTGVVCFAAKHQPPGVA